MEEKIINMLVKMFCPQEFDIEITCNLKCPVAQMEKCWDIALKEYEIKISENENKFKYKLYKHSFEFTKRIER